MTYTKGDTVYILQEFRDLFILAVYHTKRLRVPDEIFFPILVEEGKEEFHSSSDLFSHIY